MIYGDLYCLLEKMHSCQNNLEKSYTEKKSKHAPSHLMHQKISLIVTQAKMIITS